MTKGINDQRGIALVIALFALVVIGAIVGGIFFAGRLEQQSGSNTVFVMQAGAAADAGLGEGLVSLSPAALSSLVAGGAPLNLAPIAVDSLITVERLIARLAGNLFLLRAQATRRDARGEALATRVAGLLVQLRTDSTSGAVKVAPLRERSWVQLY